MFFKFLEFLLRTNFAMNSILPEWKHTGRNPGFDRVLIEDFLLEDVVLEDVVLEDVVLEDVLLEDVF